MTEDDVEAVRKFVQIYVETFNTGDLAAQERLITDDFAKMPPGTPTILGKEATLEWLQGIFDQFDLKESWFEKEIKVGVDWAYIWFDFAFQLTPKDGGEAHPERTGKGIAILARQPDGTWKVFREIWNVNPDSTTQQSAE